MGNEMEKAKTALNKTREAINNNQHSEYIEAHLSEAIQQISAFIKENGDEIRRFYQQNPQGRFTDEEWTRMREQSARWKRKTEERNLLRTEMSHEEFVEKMESGEIPPVTTHEDLEFQEYLRRKYG